MLIIVLAKRQVVLPNYLWNQSCYLYITHAFQGAISLRVQLSVLFNLFKQLQLCVQIKKINSHTSVELLG